MIPGSTIPGITDITMPRTTIIPLLTTHTDVITMDRQQLFTAELMITDLTVT